MCTDGRECDESPNGVQQQPTHHRRQQERGNYTDYVATHRKVQRVQAVVAPQTLRQGGCPESAYGVPAEVERAERAVSHEASRQAGRSLVGDAVKTLRSSHFKDSSRRKRGENKK